jgi:protein transport protein SEC24
MEKITDDGVYLLENGLYLFMYIGLAADPTWIQEVFGVQTAAQIDIDKTRLMDRDTAASQRVRAVIDQIRKERSRYFMRLVLVRQRDKLDILFRHYLCEDKTAPGASSGDGENFSYVDFLCHMHKEIRALLG